MNDLIKYNPDDGSFTWTKTRNYMCVEGAKAGCICPAQGYLRVRVNRKLYMAHRLAFILMGVKLEDEFVVDHRDGDRLNNKWSNLRKCLPKENGKNKRTMASNTTGHKGVTYHKRDKVWISYITTDGVKKHLGSFKTIGEAASVATEARIKYHKEFACHE